MDRRKVSGAVGIKEEENMIFATKTDKKKRCIIYTRCSTDDQAQGDYTTLDAQAHHCKNMIDAFGYEMADFGEKGVVNDDGYSGKDLNRPGIQSILKDIQTKKSFDAIVFFRLDRLTRNPRDLYGMIDLFKANEIDFLSVRENLDSSTAIGRVVIGIIGLLSAFERELTGERVKASAIARARQGRWVAGKPPFGYKQIPDGNPLPNGRQPHKVVLDEKIAPFIKRIFELAADNKTLTDIGQDMISNNVPTSKNFIWRKQTVAKIIKNPFYKGKVHYSGETHNGAHQAVVDEELWDRANKIVSANLPGHRFMPISKDYASKLKGILKCGHCGSSFVSTLAHSHNGKTFYYYECSRGRQRLGCDTRRMSATGFDQAVLDFFSRASKDKEIIASTMTDAVNHSKKQLTAYNKETKDLQKKLVKAKEAAERLLNLAIDKVITKGTTYAKKMGAIETEIASLEDRMSKIEAKRRIADMSANSTEYLHSNMRFAMERMADSPPEAQIALLKSLLKAIDLHDDHVIMRFYLGDPSGEISCPIEAHQERTLPGSPEQGSPVRQQWRRGRDSNPGVTFLQPHALQACAFNHSATSPKAAKYYHPPKGKSMLSHSIKKQFGRIKLVARFIPTYRMSNSNNTQRTYTLRKAQNSTHRTGPFRSWMRRSPAGSQTKRLGRNQNILRRRCTILNPIIRRISAMRKTQITGNHNSMLRSQKHFGIRKLFGHFMNQGHIINNNKIKMPGITRSRSRHAGTNQLGKNFAADWLSGITTDTTPIKNSLKNRFHLVSRKKRRMNPPL